MSKYKKPATATVGAAGVHLLAGYLSAMGLPVAVTQKNAPSIDLLVCSPDGAKSLSVQVKTMRWAGKKDGCQWLCSEGSLKEGLYAFVDLKQKMRATRPELLPDFYFVPISVVRKWHRYKPSFYKPTEQQIGSYRNNWDLVRQRLGLA